MPVLTDTEIPIVISSQISDYGRGLVSNHINFKGADLIVMNKLEAEFNLDVGQTMENLPEIFGCDICVTSGRGGSTLFMDGKKYHSDVIDIEEVDPCGAGDSFISALSLSNWKEFPENSLFISNSWAGLTVQNHGTVCPKKKQLNPYLREIV
jgi:bifunctional ADP-heptose synthase (sugar kinase/adenylyltransferase)